MELVSPSDLERDHGRTLAFIDGPRIKRPVPLQTGLSLCKPVPPQTARVPASRHDHLTMAGAENRICGLRGMVLPK